MDFEQYKFNKYLSSLKDLKLDLYPNEIQEQFVDFLNTVPYLRNLTNDKRPYAKDCKRDNDGKIIVDLTNPPIIEDTDYFRPTALYFQKHGVLTNLRPNSNPNSAYGKWIREEVRRCYEGYVRPLDGAWVTGDMYFFLNYCPILKVKTLKGKKGVRIVDFPDFLEGLWCWFMYLLQARDNAKHAFLLAARGKGKAHPYNEKVITPNGVRKWRDIKVGDMLYGDDGEPTKVVGIPYDSITDIYQVCLSDGRSIRCTSGHLFKVIDYTLNKEIVLPLCDIIGSITYQEDDTLYYRYGIPQCLPVQHEYLSIPCSASTLRIHLNELLKGHNDKERYTILELYVFNTINVRKDALCSLLNVPVTLLGKKELRKTDNKILVQIMAELARSLGLKCTICKNTITISTYSALYSNIVAVIHKGRSRAKCVTVDNNSHCYLIDDYVVTHNSYTLAAIAAKRFILGDYDEQEHKTINHTETFIAAYRKDYLTDDGVLNKFLNYIDFCADYTLFPRKRLISSFNNMHWQMGYKENDSEARRGSLNEVIGISVKDTPSKLRGKRGSVIGLEEAGAFNNLKELYGTLRPSMEDGDVVFGQIIAQGTSGSTESDFTAALDIMYSPKAYNMYALPNVFDKAGQGRSDFTFFYPGYVNRNGCYNNDGISDCTKAMLLILINRYNVKYNSKDSTLITSTIAEIPIVPLEAILKTKGNIFPTVELTERLNELDNNPNIYDDVYVGTLILNNTGEVAFKPTADEPIRVWPTKDNKVHGALEIYAMPELDLKGHIYGDRYIASLDPVDSDLAETMSLTSAFILDLFTDKIVAEYTGRMDFADDNYELIRRLCIFYNAQCMYESNLKGFYAYMKEHNSLNYLALTPEYLKDLQIIKEHSYGNSLYGIRATAGVNNYGDRLIREWLIKPVTVTDKDNNTITMPNLKYLRDRALIQELIAYNPLANFDRIRSMSLLMLYRQSKVIDYEGDLTKSINEIDDKDYAGNDDFFTENYDNNPRAIID